MTKIGLDIGTGFVKCVSDYGRFKFPSLYARRINGIWTDKITEAVGEKATQMLKTSGTMAISPICRGRPEKRYLKQVKLLVTEAINRVYHISHHANQDMAQVIVGLPYEAAQYKGIMSKMIGKVDKVEKCDVVAQAAGTLVSLQKNSGMVVSIGQGTSEIVIIEDNKMIDGQSLEWASEFITRKIGRFAHLDTEQLVRQKGVCTKYAKALAENLAIEITDMASAHGYTQNIILSGGGILIPGVRKELTKRLSLGVLIPEDPVMSNAIGLYRLAQ